MSKLKKIKKTSSQDKEKKSFFNKFSENRLFKHILCIINSIEEDKITAFASEAALFTIISFFPFLMLFFIIVSFTTLTPAFIIRLINDSFPTEVINLIMTVVDQLNNTSRTVITLTIFTALWSASRGFMAIVKGLDVIYKSTSNNNMILHRIYAILYTFGFALLLAVTLVLLGFGNSLYIWIVQHFPIVKDLAILIMGMRESVLLTILLFFFLIMYIVLPNRKSNIVYELPGAVLSSLGWVGFSYGFSFYIDRISNFSYIYGSLTAIVLLLLWVYFCMLILFIGAELNNHVSIYLHEKYKQKNEGSRLLRLRNFAKNLGKKKDTFK